MAGDRELKAMETTLAALLPLDPDERQRVFDWLVAKVGVRSSVAGAATGTGRGTAGGTTASGGAVSGTIKQFLKDKSPDEDVARAAALAYFLTHAKNQATYKTGDLTTARSDAALANFNMSRAVSTAQRAGYLTTAGKRGTYQITSTGEALVEAMPDADLIKKVKAKGTRRRRRAAPKRPAKKKA